jgi:hypothetical protein
MTHAAQDFRSAFIEAWSHWEPARQFPAIRPEQIGALPVGPRILPDAIAHWQAEWPFRPSLTGGYRLPAVALPAWGELARDGYGDTAWWLRRPRRTWREAVTGHGQRGIESSRDLLWLV